MDLIDFRRVPESPCAASDRHISFKRSAYTLVSSLRPAPRVVLPFFLFFCSYSVAPSQHGGNLTWLIHATNTTFARV